MKLRLLSLLLLALSLGHDPAGAAQPVGEASEAESAKPPSHKAKSAKSHRPSGSHRVAKRQRGKASYYSRKFAGKKMADGTPMNPRAPVAASKTLPLGTKARVKNLETGDSTVVEIKDRGPYVKGRIIDLSPKAAEEIDMKKDGVAPVEVTPIETPKPRGQPEAGEPNPDTGRKSVP